MPPGAISLRDYPGPIVRITCAACGRAGSYRREALLDRFGRDAGLPDVLAQLSEDCDRRRDWRQHGPCGAGFPDLVP